MSESLAKSTDLQVCEACRQGLDAGKFKPDSNVCKACAFIQGSRQLRSQLKLQKKLHASQIQARLNEAELSETEIRDAMAAMLRQDRQNQKDPGRRQDRIASQARHRLNQQKANLTKTLDAQDAERELAARVLARRHLLHFLLRMVDGYQPGWAHEHICTRLQRFMRDVEQKQSPRLMLFLPPRFGKSTIASTGFPAYALGHHPEWEFIVASYALSLPLGFSRQVQGMLKETSYQSVFPDTKINPDTQSIEHWLTLLRGGFLASGVGGGITGKGAHILIIDDPVKDAQEADSPVARQTVWDWYQSTAKTRLAPGGGILVIQTRWHDDDLSGRLLQQEKELTEEVDASMADAQARMGMADSDAERAEIREELSVYQRSYEDVEHWDVVSYPAIAEEDEYLSPDNEVIKGVSNVLVSKAAEFTDFKLLRRKGEALHPERFPIGLLRRYKKSMNARFWTALYQQDPVPEEGDYFNVGMFRFVPDRPRYQSMYVYSAWDLAIGEKQTNDYTVGSVGALDHQGQLHILDIVRGKWDSFAIVEAIFSVYARFPEILLMGIEKGQLEMAIFSLIKREMHKRRVYPTFTEGKNALVPVNDKLIRARPLQGMMQQGMVLFPNGQPWVKSAMHELLRFPNAKFDDQVDSLAWLARMALAGPAPRAPNRTDPCVNTFLYDATDYRESGLVLRL